MDGDIAPLDVIVALGKKTQRRCYAGRRPCHRRLGQNGSWNGGTLRGDWESRHHHRDLQQVVGQHGGCGLRFKIFDQAFEPSFPPIYFSTAVSPVVCATALAAIEVLETEPQWIEKLHRNRRFLVDGLKSIGFNALDVETAIIPILIGNERMTYALTHALYDSGVFVNAVSRPSVPRELSRIRISPMAIHTEEELGRAVAAFKTAGKRLGLI